MSDYIEREALLDKATIITDKNGMDCWVVFFSDVCRAPAADVAPVVHEMGGK